MRNVLCRGLAAALLAGLVAGPLAACDGSTAANLFISNEQEVEIGQSVEASIACEYRIAQPTDPVSQWANEFVAQLVPASSRFRDPDVIQGYKTAVIVDDQLVNAFAAPGGYVYLTTALVMEAETCGEIAGVMGHELAHVTQRHGMETLVKVMGLQVLLDLFISDETLKAAAGGLWQILRGTANSRENEAEADEVGLQIAHDAGYNPYGLVVFFQKILALEQRTGSPPEFLSTHPATQSRIDEVTKEIKNLYGDLDPETALTWDCVGTTLSLQQVKERIQQGVAVVPGSGDPNAAQCQAPAEGG